MINGLDYQDFHPDCKGVEVINSPKGMLLHCPTCRILADAQDCSKRISNADAKIPGKVARADFHYTTEVLTRY